MLGDAELEKRRRRYQSAPDDLEALLRYIDGLRRREHDFLELAVLAVRKGVVIGPEGIDRAWFRPYWQEAPYDREGTESHELFGPFVDLSHRRLNFAQLESLDLRYATFRMSEMKGLIVSESQLQHCDFQEADLSEWPGSSSTQWSAVDLSHSQFENCNLRGATFQDIRATKASFEGAQLPSASFYQSEFAEANMRSTQLAGSRVYGCEFQRALFEGASMEGLVFDTDTIWPESLNPFDLGAFAQL